MGFGSAAGMNQAVQANRKLQKRLRNPLKDRYKAEALKYNRKATSINIKKWSASEMEMTKLRIQEESRKQRNKKIKIGLVTLAVFVIIYWYGDWSIDWTNWMAY